MSWPSLTIAIPTLNSQRTLKKCLDSIFVQDFPKDLLEVLVVDGGSQDETPAIARAYPVRFIEGGFRENMEARRGVGLLEAKNEIVAYIDSDNILPQVNYLRESLRPFVDESQVVGAQTWRFGLAPGFGLMNRYCALIGNNDPVPFYLKKNEKISYLDDDWRLTPIKSDRGGYFLVEFTPDNLTTVGTNGFFVRRNLLLKANSSPDNYFHIDVIADLISQGYNLIAMVRNDIYHDTAYDLRSLAFKRMQYFTLHNPYRSNRRYFVFNPKRKEDVFNLAKFVLCTLTLIEPLSLSVRGYLKKKDPAWFLHLYVCLSFLIAYFLATIKLYLKSLGEFPKVKKTQT